MDAPTVYREDQHYQNICDGVGELWRQRSLCDVHILVEDAEGRPKVSLPAHKVILAACIPYFRGMFTTDMQESGQHEVKLRDVDEVGLKAIMGFVYSGKLELTETNAQGVLSTASMLGLQNMVEACARFMMKHLSPSNCLGMRRFGGMYNLSALQSAADKYARSNFARVMREEEFLGLSLEEVGSFVADDEIKVETEEDIYTAVTRWLNHEAEGSEATSDGEGNGRHQFAAQLYNHVRFPVLDLNFLKGVVSHNQLVTSVARGKVMLKEALEYHENPASVMQFSNPKKTQPRSSMMGVICVVGGSGDAGESLSDVTFFNPHEQQWKAGTRMLTHRSRLALVLFRGELYAIGGADIKEPLASVEKYSPVTDTWSQIAPLNRARRSCAAVVTKFGIYVLGGFSDVFLHSVELYNPELNEWTYQIPMIEARSDLCTVFYDQRIYAIGGSNSSSSQLRSVERFDLINRKWENVASMNAPRANAGMCV